MKSGIASTFFSRKSSMGIVLSIAVFAALSLTSGRSFGQARPSTKTQVISVDPLGLAYQKPLNIQYEYKAGPIYSWALRAHYWPSLNTDWSGFGLGGAYRIYIADSRAITGLAIAPAVDLLLFREVFAGATQRSAIVAWIGGDLSYKWIFDQFAIEPMFGLRIGFGGREAPADAATLVPILALNIGYAW